MIERFGLGIRGRRLGMLAGALLVLMGADAEGCGEGGEGEPPAAGCFADDDCSEDLVCNAAEVCLPPPGCGPGQVCPTVCYGECVAPEAPTGCYGDDDCAQGQVCNAADVCLPPPGCEAGQACPAVCYGECVSPADR